MNEISPVSFGVKPKNTKCFREIVDYAAETNQLRVLDNALHNLSLANGDADFLIMHGKTPNGVSFSNFSTKKGFLQNECEPAQNPVEASFWGLVNLSMLGKKFERLFKTKPETELSAEKIIAQYGKVE